MLTQDQGMDIVGSFVGIHGFQVTHVTNYRVFINDPVSTQYIPGSAGYL